MQFRLREGKNKHTVFCVRTVYKPEKKQGEQRVIANFNADGSDFPTEKMKKDLTETEMKQAQDWLEAHQRESRKSRARVRPSLTMSFVRDLISTLQDPELKDEAIAEINPEEIYGLIDDLTRALKKHKIVRPKAVDKASSEPVSDPVSSP